MYGTLSDPVVRTGFGLDADDDGWIRVRIAKYPAVEVEIARATASTTITAW